MSLTCGADCGGISWNHFLPQLVISGILWAALLVLGFFLAVTGATSNVDAWIHALTQMKQTQTSSKVLLYLEFMFAVVQSAHFAARTYTHQLHTIGLVLEVVPAVYYLFNILPAWGLAQCSGIMDGFLWMCTYAIPDSILIGSIAGLPFTGYEDRMSWFAPSWLASLHIMMSFPKILNVHKVNLDVPRHHIAVAIFGAIVRVYFASMCMLSLENLGEPEFFKPFVRDRWNTISTIYFVLTSITTVGFGDLAPATSLGRLFVVCAIYGGLAWSLTTMYKLMQNFAINSSAGGFFVPGSHSKYILVLGSPTTHMLRNFILEIFHPDHAEDADDLHMSVLLPTGHPAKEELTSWLKLPVNLLMSWRLHLFSGTALDSNDLIRVSVGAATCVFVLPDLLASSAVQEDTENIIRMMAVQRLVPKVRVILLLLRAENIQLLSQARMTGYVTCVAYDQFKMEIAGKTCQVHGFGSLVSNLCKSIAIDDEGDEEDGDEKIGNADGDAYSQQWRKDFERGCGLEVYEIELSSTYAAREATFIEVVVDVIEQTGGLVYLIGLVECRAERKKVLINPGPSYKIKQALGGIQVFGVFLASDREAVMQCDVGTVFLGRRERASVDDEAGAEGELGFGAVKTLVKYTEEAPIDLADIPLRAEQKDTSVILMRSLRATNQSLVPQRPPIKMLTIGGHIIVLSVGTEQTEDLRLGIEHFLKPLRRNVNPDDMVPVVVMSATQPRDWVNVHGEHQVYWVQGSPTALADLSLINFTKASAIYITHCGAGRSQESAENQESWAVDFEVICCTRLVESQLDPTSSTVVISDIVVDSNHPFLPLPGDYGGGDSQKKNPRRSSIRKSLQSLTGIGDGAGGGGSRMKKIKNDEYFTQPRFAAGRLLAGATAFSSLAANTFYNPTLIDLVSTMITTQITMVTLPHAWEGKSFFELFDSLLWKQKLLAIGIYRHAEMSPASSGKKNRHKLGFVYTAPPGKETAMMPGDQVICFQCPEDL
eukprot:TRINITY_DN28619_c0_g1_i1.p1 TRINITY_DN28619_c0_g1~~TRINITY_DN28619_c0_g1_i1.p1  ORF type:complete len:994 (+),score=111.32 TRINITY_DN28619_c0_g1_i1:263-3244(+)